MKTLFKLSVLVILFSSIVCCSNTTNNPNIILTEDTTISVDTSSINDWSNNDTTYIVWTFKSINNENLSDYIYENIPFLTFSLDSNFVMINAGCNFYIGECTFNYNNIKFEKIRLKEEVCPIDALEREIIYMLESSNTYSKDNNNLILFSNNYPIGLLTIDTIIFSKIYH